ncbi:MAG: hypothetical protein FWE13_06670 [Firmicutes bacterium]|nr:hypothetical protein [Bacillota bacterium]
MISIKKIFREIMILGMAVVMLFFFVALAGCESVTSTSSTTTDTTTCDTTVTTPVCPLLEEYMANTIKELEDFVNALDENDFASANWNTIQSRLTVSRNTINAAIDKEEVRTAFNTAKQQIETVPQRDPNPPFIHYELNARYHYWDDLIQEGMLARKHIKNIAYHTSWDGVVRDGARQIIEFEPTSIGVLCEERQLLLHNLFNSQHTFVPSAIFKYLGTYNGIIITHIRYLMQVPAGGTQIVANIIINIWGRNDSIFAWRPNPNYNTVTY